MSLFKDSRQAYAARFLLSCVALKTHPNNPQLIAYTLFVLSGAILDGKDSIVEMLGEGSGTALDEIVAIIENEDQNQ